jgi:hypothetical protein
MNSGRQQTSQRHQSRRAAHLNDLGHRAWKGYVRKGLSQQSSAYLHSVAKEPVSKIRQLSSQIKFNQQYSYIHTKHTDPSPKTTTKLFYPPQKPKADFSNLYHLVSPNLICPRERLRPVVWERKDLPRYVGQMNGLEPTWYIRNTERGLGYTRRRQAPRKLKLISWLCEVIGFL